MKLNFLFRFPIHLKRGQIYLTEYRMRSRRGHAEVKLGCHWLSGFIFFANFEKWISQWRSENSNYLFIGTIFKISIGWPWDKISWRRAVIDNRCWYGLQSRWVSKLIIQASVIGCEALLGYSDWIRMILYNINLKPFLKNFFKDAPLFPLKEKRFIFPSSSGWVSFSKGAGSASEMHRK